MKLSERFIRTWWIFLALMAMACLAGAFIAANAQSNQTFAQKQYWASDYGTWQIPGMVPNTYNFPSQLCKFPAPGGGNFAPFNVNAPIYLEDANAANSELLTPSYVINNEAFCGLSITPVHNHYSFSIISGTGGLQEVLNQISANIPYPAVVILDRNWYTAVNSVKGQVASNVINTVKGNSAAILVDNTQAPATTYQWSSGANQYVVVGGSATSVSYNQGGTGAVTRSSTSKWQDAISIKDFGAVGGNAALDTAGLQAAVAVASATGKSVYVPAGTYLLTNSSVPAIAGANNVMIWGDGPASSLVCQSVGGQDCIQSTGATGFGLMNLSIAFGPTATARTSGYAVDMETCTNCFFEGVSLNNGDLSGLRLASSVHTSIHNLKISNFYANGAFMINNQDLRVDGLTCQSNQDACFETSWFDSEYSAHSIPCEQISATNIVSSNDLEGILINSCRNVSVNGFSITGSGKESIFVGQDPTTTTAHWPDRVSISGGSIFGAGYGSNPLNVAAAQAIYINDGTNPAGFISHVTLSGITANHISSWGLQMAEFQNTDVDASNLQFYDVGNGNTTGCVQTEGNALNFNGLQCTDSGTYGLYDSNTVRLTGAGLVFNASSQVSGVDAIYLSTTATGFVNFTNVNIADTNATTFASQVYDASTTGQHSMWNISTTYVTSSGYLAPTSANGGTTYTYTDPGHSMVFRNGGMIQSFVPPNYYFLPTAGATPTAYVNGAVLYYQSKCWASGAQQTESVGWLDQYPTLSTESFSFNQFGGCGFPITIDMTQASSVLEPQIQVIGTALAKHLGGFASGTYASVPTFSAGTGAGTSPTISANAASSDVSGFISVTPGTSPAASATVVTGVFGTAYATLAKCSIWPANAATAALSGTSQVYSPPVSSSAFAITAGSGALTASTLYTWGYSCTQ